ncbi:MAG: hypothetical protein IT446_09435 [Phycisphaerales bacterium]|nr:hypothetical protein [Phycisphaerales bacterium]
MADFLPNRESELVTWANNFNTLIQAGAITYGLTTPQALQMGSFYSAFAAAYQTANDPATRSPSAIIAKNTAMKNMVSFIRLLARIIQANPNLSAQQKSNLGLTVRDTDPSSVNPPGSAPMMDIVSVVGRTAKSRLHDSANPTRRGRPEGVAGASIYSFVGATPPAELSAWTFVGNTSRTTCDVQFDADVPAGAVVWLTACWFNAKAQNGPTCAPVSTNLPGGGAVAA